jgi:hypothetical protein
MQSLSLSLSRSLARCPCTLCLTPHKFCSLLQGGNVIHVPFVPDEDDCNSLTAQRSMFGKRNWNPSTSKITVSKHGGIELSVNGQMIPIPLKAVFPVTCTGSTCDNSNLNWFEWFRLNIVEGDRSLGKVTPISSSSGLQFEKPFDNAGEKLFPDYAVCSCAATKHTGCSACSAHCSLHWLCRPMLRNTTTRSPCLAVLKRAACSSANVLSRSSSTWVKSSMRST